MVDTNKVMKKNMDEAMNEALVNNVLAILKQQNKKQTDLADALYTDKQTVNKMLNGARKITAVELKQISDFLDVKMEVLFEENEAGGPNQMEQTVQSERWKSSHRSMRDANLLENIAFDSERQLLVRSREASEKASSNNLRKEFRR